MNPVLYWGLCGGGIIVIYSVVAALITGDPRQWDVNEMHRSEVWGYGELGLLVLGVFFGQRSIAKTLPVPVRYTHLLAKGIPLAVLIALGSGIAQWLQLEFLRPDFFDQMVRINADALRQSGMSEDLVQRAATRMEQSFGWMRHAWAAGLFAAAQSGVIGSVCALIFSFLFRRSE